MRLLSLSEREAGPLGEELRDLVRLAKEGVPVVDGYLVSPDGDDGAGRLAEALVMTFGAGAPGVLVRALLPTHRLSERFARSVSPVTVSSSALPSDAAAGFLAALRTPELMGALGGSLARVRILVAPFGAESVLRGGAASVDLDNGDPETLVVWTSRAAPWLVDRRTARVTRGGEGPVDAHQASLVADLVDRAQLVLEHPVSLEWIEGSGRFVAVGTGPLSVVPSFAGAPYRILTLVAADEGTVAPLAIDALDRALSRDDDPSSEPRVRRIYARPYRRQDETDRHHRPSPELSLVRVGVRAARVAKDVALPLAAVRRFERDLESRLSAFDTMRLDALDDASLLRELWERQRLAVEAFILLDRHRLATIAVLGALEMAGCALPRETFPAIARPRHTRSRKRVNERLRRLAQKMEESVGDVALAEKLIADVRVRYDELKGELASTRLLGIDICQDAIGASDSNMIAAMKAAIRVDEDALQRARRAEVRRIRQSAAEGAFGRSREAFAASLVLLQSRVSRSKGVAVEGLSAVLLRVRRAALEVGRRLVDNGVLDDSVDALYMDLSEIEDALRGEPGAYASRVRLRREDDARWARFEAPRRIESRRPHG